MIIRNKIALNELTESKQNTPKLIEDHVRRIERELFYLWNFVWREDLGDEAREFIEDHKGEAIPFEW